MTIRFSQLLVALISPILITACETTVSEPPPRAPEAIRAIPPSGLGAQTLVPGECGLFLWSKTNVDRFIFFTKALSSSAVFRPEETTLNLTRSASRGMIFGQFNTEMVFTSPSGGKFTLTFQPGEDLIGGQRIEDGLITAEDQGGWVTKYPVLGVRACQPE